MTLLDAARQALEALEKCAMTIDWEWGDCRELEEMRQTGQYTDETTPAILALRQAIEQAKFDAVHDALEKEAGIHITQQAEQQEPVAWLMSKPKKQKPVAWVDGYGRIARDADSFPKGTTVSPLFAHPPQQPLTDDEIALIVGECAASAYRYDDFSFARAIERAHGIGGGE